jgi:hypothetical protein
VPRFEKPLWLRTKSTCKLGLARWEYEQYLQAFLGAVQCGTPQAVRDRNGHTHRSQRAEIAPGRR